MATQVFYLVCEVDEKVLFIRQKDKKVLLPAVYTNRKEGILQYTSHGNSGSVTQRSTTKRQNWSALPCAIEICPVFIAFSNVNPKELILIKTLPLL